MPHAVSASTSAVYQSHLSSSTMSGYPSFSSYGHHLGKEQQHQPAPMSGASTMATVSGSRPLNMKRTEIASSHGNLTGIYASSQVAIVLYDVASL